MKICKNCGGQGDINYEGLCIDCASARTEEQRELDGQNQPAPVPGELSAFLMTQVMAKMDTQIAVLNRISFWVCFWSILGIIIFILNIILGSRIIS